ncbi:hypothetical protein Salat_1870600 [Sesamum alatum]|uniref:Transducin/WD40 repeat-like superfamily protein n=1 Tax=Sesamum alatum TaxID=300844 RepID=A0AAE1Y3E0_9LAMI|nr:hypothetical protein Salat_1870600 [Sesamum alatum]
MCIDDMLAEMALSGFSGWMMLQAKLQVYEKRINLPAGGHPTAVAFAGDASSVVVASQALAGSSLYMYGEETPKKTGEQKQQGKLPLPEIKWEHHKVHDKRAIITLVSTKATYGSADGSTIIASCSQGTEKLERSRRDFYALIILFLSKVWEIVYSKDGSVKKILNVMQLKGHKSAVTWLCPNSEEIITASKDGSIRLWNINGDIMDMAWAPTTIPMENKELVVFATASTDKKVKLCASPPLHPS